MLVLSKNYLRACGEDIAAASGYLASPDQLFIVSAGGRQHGDLAAFAVPADARLQARFGGTRRALNARIGAHLLERGIRSRKEASGYLARLLSAQPPIPRYNRKRQTDREVLNAIAARLAAAPGTSANRMLHEFRDIGLACEQRRFTRLYRQATAATPLPKARLQGCANSIAFVEGSEYVIHVGGELRPSHGQGCGHSRYMRFKAANVLAGLRPAQRLPAAALVKPAMRRAA
jgi:hypothetical protein